MTISNEMLVARIRKGISVSENLQALYENNMPYIRSIVKPYSVHEPLEDLMQEAFLGLWQAVNHYDSAENVKFMTTYAPYWIKQSVFRYLQKCGSVVRYPSHTHQKMTLYRKTFERLEQEYSRTPTNEELAAAMKTDIAEVLELKIYTQEIASLDAPLTADNTMCLSDTLQGDSSPENDVVDKIYDEHSKDELWGIVEYFTHERENRAIREYYINNKSLRQIAQEYGLSPEAVRDAKEKGLRRLRIGKAKRLLLEKFDIVDAGIYRNSFNQFNEHGFTSTVEYIALRKAEIQAEYEERKRQIEAMLAYKKR